jgi:hypothetical protein
LRPPKTFERLCYWTRTQQWFFGWSKEHLRGNDSSGTLREAASGARKSLDANSVLLFVRDIRCKRLMAKGMSFLGDYFLKF